MKQRKFVKEYIKSGNQTLAAKRSYNCNDDTARSLGSSNLTKHNIKSAVIKAQEKIGITDSFLAKTLKEGLKAKETKFFADGGKVRDKRNCIDYPTRAKYMEIAHKLRGNFIDRTLLETTLPVEEVLKKFVQQRIAFETSKSGKQNNE